MDAVGGCATDPSNSRRFGEPPYDEQPLTHGWDASSFERFFDRYVDGLHGFFYRKLRSREDAEDAVVVTFYKVWRARHTFRGETSGKAWLYQIATRVALDALRARGRRPVEQELDLSQAESCGPASEEEHVRDPQALVMDAAEDEELRGAVHRALRRLPSEDERLVRQFYFDGQSYDEISTISGITVSQVRGRLHRIRLRIRRQLVGIAGCARL